MVERVQVAIEVIIPLHEPHGPDRCVLVNAETGKLPYRVQPSLYSVRMLKQREEGVNKGSMLSSGR